MGPGEGGGERGDGRWEMGEGWGCMCVGGRILINTGRALRGDDQQETRWRRRSACFYYKLTLLQPGEEQQTETVKG